MTNFLEPAGLPVSVGEGVLVLSATPELGRVEGSIAFAERYAKRFGRIANSAVNSYAAAKLLLTAIEDATSGQGVIPQRESLPPAMRKGSLCEIAYPVPTRWDAQGDNRSAVTALHTATSNGYNKSPSSLGRMRNRTSVRVHMMSEPDMNVLRALRAKYF